MKNKDKNLKLTKQQATSNKQQATSNLLYLTALVA